MYTFWSLNQRREREKSQLNVKESVCDVRPAASWCVWESLYQRLLGASIGGSWGPLSAAPGGLYRRLLGASIGGSWGPLSAAPGGLYRRLLGASIGGSWGLSVVDVWKYSIPSHIPSPASSIHSTLHRDADEQGALAPPPLPGLSVIFCPRQDIAHALALERGNGGPRAFTASPPRALDRIN